MAEKQALQPKAAIGPALRMIAAAILTDARGAISDPERTNEAAVHQFRRAMKEWRALMRLLAPFIADSARWRHEARDHARTLAQARDGAAALNAFDGLLDRGNLVLSTRTSETIRARLEALRASQERSGLTPMLRDAILVWLDVAASAIEMWPLDTLEFAAVAEQLAKSYRSARSQIPADWTTANGEELHKLRQRVVTLRYQMELVEPLWPRFGRMWIGEAERIRGRLGQCQDIEVLTRLTAPHQILAHWRSRLTPACAERSAELAQRAAQIAVRLFAERPKAFRQRLEALWTQ
ncbi:MAG TPA: CHAD domain-containing protein [Xanthobacteraceae bacterium]|nr:CHAD domain-containing protein [Xanthobacteraceae bacterium]